MGPSPSSDLTRQPGRFLPHVVATPSFERDGLAVGSAHDRGLRLHWAVVDPARHMLFTWRKTGSSFVDAARHLDASLVTNGPFSNYGRGTLTRAVVHAVLESVPAVTAGPASARQSLSDVLRNSFEAPAPLGHVVGARDGILETSLSRPRVHHFGRRAAAGFDAYAIDHGDPGDDLIEAIGGLFRCVTNFRHYTVRQHIRVGYWGLAPFVDNPIIGASTQSHTRELDGVVVFLGGWGATQRLSSLFAAIGVRDGVQIDGGDSLLLRDPAELQVGALMPPWKRLLQCWGICFRPISAPPPTAGKPP